MTNPIDAEIEEILRDLWSNGWDIGSGAAISSDVNSATKVIQRLIQEAELQAKIDAVRELLSRLDRVGLEPLDGTPSQYAHLVASDYTSELQQLHKEEV